LISGDSWIIVVYEEKKLQHIKSNKKSRAARNFRAALFKQKDMMQSKIRRRKSWTRLIIMNGEAAGILKKQ
jgi:hypothetical protein